jgi:hypothetical protein
MLKWFEVNVGGMTVDTCDSLDEAIEVALRYAKDNQTVDVCVDKCESETVWVLNPEPWDGGW